MRNAQLFRGKNRLKSDEDNLIVTKTKKFALRIVKLYKYLVEDKKEFVLSKQVLRSGTSIGANVREAVRGQSKPDFYAKMNISLKEASETEYWLELLFESGYLENNEKDYKTLYEDCKEIIKILMAITKSQKK